MERNELSFETNYYPMINPIQKIALYESQSSIYLIGSTNDESEFQVMEINRLHPKSLQIVDDNHVYNQSEISQLLKKIEKENKTTSNLKPISAFGILGFVRFLEGYYIILITKRQKVASIGLHSVYKIKNTLMKYIPNDSFRIQNSLEQRYLKMFQSMDLSSNFYFSYSYDITHTLQHNMSIIAKCYPDKNVYGLRSNPSKQFVWNNYLLCEVENKIDSNWILYVIHGFIGQSAIKILGRAIHVTLIARRSNQFAGTRFLKRGANFKGYVANFVETEQIVSDTIISSLTLGRFTSFVQIRGSVPCHWSQDIVKIVAKPPINLDLNDPFAETAAKHFNRLFREYGAPIILLNLVKKRERKKQESLLSEHLLLAVQYLNQFLPPKFLIEYNNFDMARTNKEKEAKVLDKLAYIAKDAINKIGFYQSKPNYSIQKDDSIFGKVNRNGPMFGFEQIGIIRTNCVDCLDRTNTAQFAIGKCVLAYQLCSLGVLNSDKLEFDTDCVRMFESLYEDHGDTLALQYGGSQLVHRIKTYRKTAPWSSQGNDIMQTLSRYYSNTFSDNEKQNVINLFLGIFIPDHHNDPIWELSTDYYLHNNYNMLLQRNSLTQWWDEDIMENLPYATYKPEFIVKKLLNINDIKVDLFLDYYRLHKFTLISDSHFFIISNNFIDFVPKNTMDLSPFTVRVRPGRKYEEAIKKNSEKNKKINYTSIMGEIHSNSTSPSISSNDDSEGSNKNENYNLIDETFDINDHFNNGIKPIANKNMYEIRIRNINMKNMKVYKLYTMSIMRSNFSRSFYEKSYKFNFIKVDQDSINFYQNQLKIKNINVKT